MYELRHQRQCSLYTWSLRSLRIGPVPNVRSHTNKTGRNYRPRQAIDAEPFFPAKISYMRNAPP